MQLEGDMSQKSRAEEEGSGFIKYYNALSGLGFIS